MLKRRDFDSIINCLLFGAFLTLLSFFAVKEMQIVTNVTILALIILSLFLVNSRREEVPADMYVVNESNVEEMTKKVKKASKSTIFVADNPELARKIIYAKYHHRRDDISIFHGEEQLA